LRKELEEAFGVTYHTGTIAPNGEDVVEALFRLHAKQFEGEESLKPKVEAGKVEASESGESDAVG
jgi:hypothetical protein